MAKNVIAIIGARLNSSRLPGKQLLPLAGKPLIEHLALRLQKIQNISKIILATTDDDYNQPLVDWATGFGLEVFAYLGDVNDLMGRIDSVVHKNEADVIAYICGDSPLINPQSVENLIAPLIASDDYDTAEFEPAYSGKPYIHEGFSIYSRTFWDKIIGVSKEAFEREHVGSAYHSLNKVTPKAIAKVAEDAVFALLTHRTSVDTPSDYDFMKTIYDDWFGANPMDSIVDLKWLIERLRNEPELVAKNVHVHQKTIKETSRKITILTEVNEKVGLGHLSRMIKAAKALQDHQSAGVRLLIAGDSERSEVKNAALQIIPHDWVATSDISLEWLENQLEEKKTEVLITDYKTAFGPVDDVFKMAKALDVKTISIDKHTEESDLDFIPSFYSATTTDKTIFGWDCYFLPPLNSVPQTNASIDNIVVLTGSGDTGGLGYQLPSLLDQKLTKDKTITWIVGPFANQPKIPKNPRLTWDVRQNPENLAESLSSFDAAICCYGVSFFEALKSGLPTVVIDPIGAAQAKEWVALKNEGITLTADSNDDILKYINSLIIDDKLTASIKDALIGKFDEGGGKKLNDSIVHLFEK